MTGVPQPCQSHDEFLLSLTGKIGSYRDKNNVAVLMTEILMTENRRSVDLMQSSVDLVSI